MAPARHPPFPDCSAVVDLVEGREAGESRIRGATMSRDEHAGTGLALAIRPHADIVPRSRCTSECRLVRRPCARMGATVRAGTHPRWPGWRWPVRRIPSLPHRRWPRRRIPSFPHIHDANYRNRGTHRKFEALRILRASGSCAGSNRPCPLLCARAVWWMCSICTSMPRPTSCPGTPVTPM